MNRVIAAVVAIILVVTPCAHSDEKNGVVFTVTARGELEDKAATKAGFRTYLFDYAHLAFTNLESSDGKKVTVYRAEFSNTREAQRYFDWSLERKAAQIIKQEGKADRDGKTVGSRAEFLLKSDAKVTEWEVMWTNEVHFILISAPTLECAQEVERQSER